MWWKRIVLYARTMLWMATTIPSITLWSIPTKLARHWAQSVSASKPLRCCPRLCQTTFAMLVARCISPVVTSAQSAMRVMVHVFSTSLQSNLVVINGKMHKAMNSLLQVLTTLLWSCPPYQRVVCTNCVWVHQTTVIVRWYRYTSMIIPCLQRLRHFLSTSVKMLITIGLKVFGWRMKQTIMMKPSVVSTTVFFAIRVTSKVRSIIA